MMMRGLLLLSLLMAGGAPARTPVYDSALEARVFDKAWHLVEKHYWDHAKIAADWSAARDRFRARAVNAPDQRRFYTILGEMLASLGDSHVFAIDPVQLAIGKARDDGQASQGFGFAMQPDDEAVWRVTWVRPNSSAARAGVEIGWEVHTVNGQPVDIDYRPAAAEQASFAFVDEAMQAHDFRLTAELEQPRPERRVTRLPGNVLLIGLDGFDPGADRWMRNRLAEAAPAGVILDLRDNDGGDAQVIGKVAGLFYTENRPLVWRIAQHQKIQNTRGAGARSYTGPLVVLVSSDSASGAEALAALVDESKRGTTIGQRTAGALTGAAKFHLPDGGELSVAEFDIRTPGGQRLEGVGLTPRILIAPSLADKRAGRDPVLDRARLLVSSSSASR
jgi:carboxyl-terminal processing protease